MKNLFMTALYGSNWHEDAETDDLSLLDGQAGRIVVWCAIVACTPFLGVWAGNFKGLSTSEMNHLALFNGIGGLFIPRKYDNISMRRNVRAPNKQKQWDKNRDL